MAARVTKLFLQNCLAARDSNAAVGKKNAGTKKNGAKSSSASAVKVSKSSSRRRKSKAKSASKSTSGVRFLEAAQREQQQADKTQENLRKLKTRANDKSQRLMAKALAKRQALRL